MTEGNDVDTLRIDVFSIFPRLVDDFCSESLLGKARDNGLLDLRCHDLREYTTDKHRTVDDSPFGGGAGMVMRPEPIAASIEANDPPRPLFLMSPGGRRFDQALAELPAHCDRGTKKNAKGYRETWIGYKLHADVSDCCLPISAALTVHTASKDQVRSTHSPSSEPRPVPRWRATKM